MNYIIMLVCNFILIACAATLIFVVIPDIKEDAERAIIGWEECQEKMKR